MNITRIYLVTNCYNDPNKVYIGKTKNSRLFNHKKTYGDDIIYTYIDEINSLNRKDWEPLETYWIEQFITWGFEVVNKRKRGGSGTEYQSNETKLKISSSNKGKPKHSLYSKKCISNKLKGIPKSNETKLKMSHPRLNTDKMKKPKLTSKKGIYHKSYGVKKSKEFCELLSKQRIGISFSEETKRKISENKINKGIKPVLQYDLEGNFIKEWESIKSTRLIIKGDVQACCNNKQKTAGGYLWKYKK
jgi:hypothetical protein